MASLILGAFASLADHPGSAGLLALGALGSYVFFAASVSTAAKAVDMNRRVGWLFAKLMIPVAGPVIGIAELLAAKRFADTAGVSALA